MDNQIYYHFLSAKNAINDLENGRIKVSTIDVLNDPFEFMPYRRYGNKERQPYNRVYRTISKKWGVLCFSQIWTEQLLWAHYADKHKGVVLGFEIPSERILKVKYTPNKIRTKFNLTDNQDENEKKFLDLATEKYNEWEYEKEFRILIKLADCILDDGLYFLPFGEILKIKEIVLGCRLNNENEKEEIVKHAKRLKTKIIQTRPGWEDYMIHKCGTKTNQLFEILKMIDLS